MRVGFIEYARVTCWLHLNYYVIAAILLLWGRVNCFKNRRYILESLCLPYSREHPFSSSVNDELCADSCEDNSL